jgi:hypothetical protein
VTFTEIDIKPNSDDGMGKAAIIIVHRSEASGITSESPKTHK